MLEWFQTTKDKIAESVEQTNAQVDNISALKVIAMSAKNIPFLTKQEEIATLLLALRLLSSLVLEIVKNAQEDKTQTKAKGYAIVCSADQDRESLRRMVKPHVLIARLVPEPTKTIPYAEPIHVIQERGNSLGKMVLANSAQPTKL